MSSQTLQPHNPLRASTQVSDEPINTMTPWHPVRRPVARVLAAVLLCNALAPLSVLAQDASAQSALNLIANTQLQRLSQWPQSFERAKADLTQIRAAAVTNQIATTRTARNLSRAHELVRALVKHATAETPSAKVASLKSASQQSIELQQLRDLFDSIDSDTDAALAEFHASRSQLSAQQLNPNTLAILLARHDQTETELSTRAQTLRQRLRSWKANPNEASLSAIHNFFEQYPAARISPPLDPSKLPWSTPKPNTRQPAETKTAWYQNLYADQHVKLAQTDTTIGGIQFSIPPEPSQTPNAADLAETSEVALTPVIKAKATELGNNPVTIHNWVINNIQYLPTWGAIQSADYTLTARKGNAFDTASLEIALLRAANIPARYQFGTVDIAAERVQNWVGGVTTPQAALNLLNQGGIAAMGLAQAGRITTIRLEHVWVNAYVNWTPSRGNLNASTSQHVNPNGLLNAWVPLDASYKQYDYALGINLKTAVPVNGNALIQAVQQGATLTPNYAQNLNLTALQTQMTSYQNQVKAYIDSSTTGANFNVDDVLGKQTIRSQAHTMLAGTLPYATVLVGNQTVEIPDGLRWKIDFHGSELEGTGGSGNTLIRRMFNLSDLLQRRVGITYEGATPIDQQSIASYRISGAAAFPAYTLRVRPLFQIDGVTVVSGDTVSMAKDVEWQVNVIPAGQTAQTGLLQTYTATAGDETVWAVIGDSISAKQLSSMNFPATSSGNLHAVGMSYWHQVDAYASLIARRESAVVQRMPSLGAVSSGLQVQYIWGVPRSASYLGRTMDIGHSIIGIQGMEQATFQREQGMRTSYLEGDAFDQVFGRETGTSVSAVRLIQTAMESGLRVFTLTSANVDQFLGQIQMSNAVREEVVNALIGGLQVTIPESEQNVNGWQGTAYIAIRPETGVGAYIISGSLRGAAETGDCQLQPSTEPANTTNFTPAVLFAAAIIALLLIATISPVLAGGIAVGAVSQVAVAAPVPQLPPLLDAIWNRLSGSRPWPAQFNWPPAGMPNAKPPGMCTAEQHAVLEAAKDAACENPLANESCKGDGSMTCALLQQKGAAMEQCIVARLLVMDTCFLGGDSGHWEQIEGRLKQRSKCGRCLALQEAKQCKAP